MQCRNHARGCAKSQIVSGAEVSRAEPHDITVGAYQNVVRSRHNVRERPFRPPCGTVPAVLLCTMITRLPSEQVNFWTHFAGFLAGLPFVALLVAAAWPRPDRALAAAVYGAGALFLFFCSAWYHRHKAAENGTSVWRTLDHFAIFVMIAATYTPVVWVWFDEPWRTATLAFQWGVTLLGLGFKVLWPRAPRWIDPVLYLLMGWVAALAVVPLWQKMPPAAFWDLAAGGLWYTVGAVVYAFKRPRLWPGRFGFHELFHVFILGGAVSHASLVWRTVSP